MRTIKARAAIGPDHTLHLKLPDDTPTGDVDVVVTFAPGAQPSLERRRAAARAGAGILKGSGYSVDEFLRERREEEERRDRFLSGELGS